MNSISATSIAVIYGYKCKIFQLSELLITFHFSAAIKSTDLDKFASRGEQRTLTPVHELEAQDVGQAHLVPHQDTGVVHDVGPGAR
jgi:hypothetical protein